MSLFGCENATYHGCENATIIILGYRYLRFYIEGIYFTIEIPIGFEEPLDSACFKNKGEIWFNQETGSCFNMGTIQFMFPFEGIDATGAPKGGSCFNRE